MSLLYIVAATLAKAFFCMTFEPLLIVTFCKVEFKNTSVSIVSTVLGIFTPVSFVFSKAFFSITLMPSFRVTLFSAASLKAPAFISSTLPGISILSKAGRALKASSSIVFMELLSSTEVIDGTPMGSQHP